MPLALKVWAELDEHKARQEADKAVRVFGDAGKRGGAEFTGGFTNELASKLDDRALSASVRRLESEFSKGGKTSADAFHAALAAESARTGVAADKIGAELTKHLKAHGEFAGDAFVQGFTNKLSYAAPQFGNILSGVGRAAKAMGIEVSAGAAAGAAGVASLGAAAILVTDKLYKIGETFDNVSKSVEIRTGKMGSDLEALTTSIDHVATRTASSIEKIGGIGGQVSVAFGLSGKPLEDLTKQIADFERMTGENVNIRDFGKMMRGFGIDGADAGKALDDLYNTSTHTLAPVGELMESLKKLGPAARDLGLNMGQTAGLIDAFDAAGLDADSMQRGLNTSVSEAVKHHLDLKTVLIDAITQMQQFIAVGNTDDANKLAEKFFGTRGATLFIDALKRGKVSVDDINKSMDETGPGIEKMNDSTLRWADTWTIVKNRIDDALKSLSGSVFEGIQRNLRMMFTLPEIHPPPGLPSPSSGPVSSLFPGMPSAPPGIPGGLPPVPGGVPSLLLPGGGIGGPPGALNPWYNSLYGPNAAAGSHPPAPTPSLAPEDTGGGGGGQDVLGALDVSGKPKKGSHTLPEAPELPFGPGYGASPRPDETSEQYSAEQRVIEERHNVEQLRARVTQLEHDNNATADDIQKAKNAVLKAQQTENQAELSLYEEQNKALTKHADSMKELGAKIDDDFGISKGLSGIADNIIKFVGNLMMAGPLAAMNKMVEQSGVRELAPGAGGLIGMGAVTGAFGPGFMAGGGGRGGGGAGGGGIPQGPFGGYPGGGGGGGGAAAGGAFGPGGAFAPGGAFGAGGVGLGDGIPAAGFGMQTPPVDEASMRAWAQQTFGIPNTMGGSSWNNASHVDDGLLHHTGQGGQKHVGSGYAMDFHGTPEQMDAMANWIATNMSPETMELIHQGPDFDASRGIKNGRQMDFGPDLDAQHRDHVHWATTTAPWDMAPGGPLQGPGAQPGPDMSTDASGAVQSQPAAPSGFAGGNIAPSAFNAGGSGGGGGSGADWLKIAGAESSGNWGINTGNGFQGGLQFTPGTWGSYGGQQFAPGAAGATPDQQMTVGDRVLSTGFGGHPPQGPGAWPATSAAHPDWFAPGGGPGGGGGFHASPAGFGPDQPGSVQGGPGQGPTSIGGASPAPGIGGGMPGGGGGIMGSIGGAAESAIGGVAPAAGLGGGMSAVGGGAAAGAGAGAASLGIGMAIQIAMQEAQRAIQYAGAVGGIATEGLLQTFLPTGGSDLAQKSWLTRIAGGLAGARPQIPNAAGKATTQSGGAPGPGGPGGAPLPPGQGGGQGGGQDGQGGGNTMTHNGDVNINAPSSDPNAIAGAFGAQQQQMYGGQGPNNGR